MKISSSTAMTMTVDTEVSRKMYRPIRFKRA
jgi:hypothetical protein